MKTRAPYLLIIFISRATASVVWVYLALNTIERIGAYDKLPLKSWHCIILIGHSSWECLIIRALKRNNTDEVVKTTENPHHDSLFTKYLAQLLKISTDLDGLDIHTATYQEPQAMLFTCVSGHFSIQGQFHQTKCVSFTAYVPKPHVDLLYLLGIFHFIYQISVILIFVNAV